MNPYQERNLVFIVAGVAHVHRRDGDVMLSHLDAVFSFAVLDKPLEVIAQLLDIGVFNRLRRQSWWRAPIFGTLAGSVVDTLVFFSVAFAPAFWCSGCLAGCCPIATPSRHRLSLDRCFPRRR